MVATQGLPFMGQTNSDLAGLTRIHELDDMVEIRAMWRRGMATLASVASEHQPVPLEGLGSDALLAGARVALSSGLLDDLDFLSRPSAALAIFELASALPRSEEKRDLGRRVLRTLHAGNAETFVALATALALGSSRGLSGPQIRARMSLSLFLPVDMSTRAGVLALALISHGDSERQWLSEPSTGSLPSRRLAARVIERAAREAARRAAAGDDAGLQAFRHTAVASAFDRLLGDRESLVWRHVAVARGILSGVDSRYSQAIERGLDDDAGAGEWRRSVASLAARIAIEPKTTTARCREILKQDIVQRDECVTAAMVLGLGAAGEAELEAADDLLGEIIEVGGRDTIEALADVRRERIGREFGPRAAARARASLLDRKKPDDDGERALQEALYAELSPPERRMSGIGTSALLDALANAHRAFAEGGPQAAREPADRALELALQTTTILERTTEDTQDDRIQAFLALREIDHGLLETTVLGDLLTLRSQQKNGAEPLARIHDRLATWLLDHESSSPGPDSSAGRAPNDAADDAPGADPDDPLAHRTRRMRQLRCLLHLVDADGAVAMDRTLRDRRKRCVRILLERMSHDEPEPLRRMVCAALARTCDALVREELYELSDVFIAVAFDAGSESDLAVLGEASMEPSFEALMLAQLATQQAVAVVRKDATRDNVAACLNTLRTLAQTIPTAQSPRVEALRAALLGFADALIAVSAMRSLSDFANDTTSLGRLESSAEWLAQLVSGATRRLGRDKGAARPRSGAALRTVDAAVERALRGDSKGLSRAINAAARVLRVELPPLFAEIVTLILGRVTSLPASAMSRASGDAAASSIKDALRMVPWLPLGRTLGRYYILHAIGRGSVGSVFLARRAEHRDDESAESFALKVPEYHGGAAHSLSETEFYDLFCDQARELSSLPEHRNLARFIDFDGKRRPKPFLVMELVSGPTLERVFEREELTMAEALAILDGVAAGISAMHEVGLAHLDLKPSNVVLRPTEGAGKNSADAGDQPRFTPVLVDFGLAGRRLRPGCASLEHGAPEIWRDDLDDRTLAQLDARAADVYAFATVAFQILTSEPLFSGDTAVQLIKAHRSHDGDSGRIKALARFNLYTPLANALASGLRQNPDDRVSIAELRQRLAQSTPRLLDLEWPLVVE